MTLPTLDAVPPALTRADLVAHLRAYGYEHFDSEEYWDWGARRLGKHAARIDRMRARNDERESPARQREFVDYVSAAGIRGVVASVQTDDIAQATWLVGEALAGRARVLDAGCGTGEASTWFARIGGPARQVVGIEFASKAIMRASAQAKTLGVENVTFSGCDFSRELPEGPFDAVVDMAALQYATDVTAAMGRVRDALADGGVLVAAPMLGRVWEIEAYLTAVAAAGLRLHRFGWVFARDLGRNVARPLVVAGTTGETLALDVRAAFRESSAHIGSGRVVPLFETAACPNAIHPSHP